MVARWIRSVTVGGLIGTGTTTACRVLSERSSLPWVYAGQIFRQMATERGMNLAQFSTHAEQHSEHDLLLDAKQAELLRGPPLILEGRLSGFLAFRDHVPAVKFWFTCDPYVRARRVVEREGGDVEARLAEMRRREESERKRYLALYGFDLNDLGVYDLVLDTSELSRAQVVDAVVREYERRTKPKWWKFGRA